MNPKRLFQLLIIASLLISGISYSPQQAAAAKAQPQLAQMAAEQPGALVRVIVQKMAGTTGTEERVAALGGKVTQDLHIINAFVAEMTAEAALELARIVSVHWVSLDAPVEHTGGPINTTNLASAYVKAVGADRVWNQAPKYLQGEGIRVAVVDSGYCDLCGDLLFSNGKSRYWDIKDKSTAKDKYGHGSLVAGVLAANGAGSNGQWIGIAPNVDLIDVRVADQIGQATTADVVAGLQWVLDNKKADKIKVVNLSLNSTVAESYNTSPLDAAVEILWFNGIVVVVSAGNSGGGTLYAPANDPFVITVGAADDHGTASLNDDNLATFSAYGTTESGFAKPDLVAPGTNLISFVPAYKNTIKAGRKSNLTGQSGPSEYYMHVSGTSFSAPIVAGAVALLLQDEPNLTPDQVKYRLMATANKTWAGYNSTTAGAGYLDIYAAVYGTTTQSANTNILPSNLLTTGTNPITFGSVGWNSVGWNSVGWNSVGWNSVGWNSVGWNSDYWGQ
jgi:serine protease AprX